ncbi:sugar ABC transporter substrate-binding protein [Methylobacter sp.]|uniref:ABC transporter substrate-binding protein n=1 Tax=Methylobacter sp. TaxID=2051955 RepID=UPI002488CD63|nr:sugar ABC transporter substrate-binding protein [Methylobacter sp.]MDI1276175.1 sugar ABC transporter substrate-binding protein [Methylobacter sp.]MDI1356937.1 sugar ABC transporter substrate-binding protein [Methylobacter sp.]
MRTDKPKSPERDGVCNPRPAWAYTGRSASSTTFPRNAWERGVTSRQSLHSILISSLILTVFTLGIGDAHSANKKHSAVDSGVKTVSLWSYAGANAAEYVALKASVDRYNAGRHGYRIEALPSFSFKGYDEQVDDAAETGALPCLLQADASLLYAMAWSGYLQPIDQLMPKPLLDDVLPSILAQGRYDGRLYSLGQFDSGLALWGNRRLLDKAGVRIPTLQAPWTLAEFEQVLDKLSKLPGVPAAIDMGAFSGSGEFYPYAYSPILQGFGGDLIERGSYRSAKGVLDGPQSVAAMNHFQQWLKKGWFRSEVVADDFVNGKVALSWFGHWQYPWYSEELGKDLVLLPMPDFGHGIKTGMGSWSWAISSTCKEPDGAADFLNFLMSEREILRMTAVNGAVPSRRSVLARSPLYGERGPLRLYAQQLDAGLAIPRPQTPAYRMISKVFSTAVAAIIAGADVQTELSRAAALIDQDIIENRGYSND